MSKDLDKNFEEALNSFDFHRVQSVMEFMGWEWITNSGLMLPDVLEMRATVISLYNDIHEYYHKKRRCCF
jgi:hypothetical protein